MQNFREEFKKIIEKSYIPHNANKNICNDVWKRIYDFVLPNIPEKLFRYRGIDNNRFSIKSFKEGTISLCHAGMFPDKYDSLLYVNQDKIVEDLKNGFKSALRITISNIDNRSSNIVAEKAAKVCYYRECGFNEEQIIEQIIDEEYNKFCDDIGIDIKNRESRLRRSKNTAKIACFTESVQSKYMWDRYASGYTGFALEYDLRECIFKYSAQNFNINLFPIIYSELRPDVTINEGNIHTYEYFKRLGGKKWLNILNKMIPINQLHWYTSYLYKDKKEYEHEHEWRMLYYNIEDENDYVSIPDMGCLKAIYYGPDISSNDKAELHEIASTKGIKEYDVCLDTNSRKYDLKIIPFM